MVTNIICVCTLYLHISDILASPQANYWIVDTDYDTYSLVYSCVDINGYARGEIYWILARENTLPDDTIARLKKVLTERGLIFGKFYKTGQKDCNY